MERLANYQQMVDPTMVWGSIKSNDAVRMDVSFTWKKEEWLIPAVFPLPGGLVVDVARKLPYYHLKNRLTIYEKHRNAGFHSPLERLMMDQYDPFHFHPMGHLLTGNDCIDEWRSERFIWNPLRMSPIASKEHYSARKLVEHYGFDLNTGWVIFRLYFKSELLSVHDQELTLMLEAPDEPVPGPILKIEEAGQHIVFQNPLTKKAEMITVTVLENGVIEHPFKKQGPVKYPANYVILHYRFHSEKKEQQYCLMDTWLTDEPIELEPSVESEQPHPEEAQLHDPRFSKVTLQDYVAENKNHAAYSSLTHYPRLSTEWQFVAIRKERKNVRVKLKRDWTEQRYCVRVNKEHSTVFADEDALRLI